MDIVYENNVIATYAAYTEDESLRLTSSSGAVFSLLAEQILSKGGVVYGVAMTSDCRGAEFIRVDKSSGLCRLRGSKYLQASVDKTYQQVKKDLNAGVLVLFSGVGCQINGLKTFLNRDYDNLFCVDVVCHGVPSPALWRKYVSWMEEKNEARLISVNFRCKDVSWSDFGMKELSNNKKGVYISKDRDSFMQMFLRNYCLRPSCYECVAKDIKMSDLTIADFWGIKDVAPEMDDKKGTSLVLIRTNKGAGAFEDIRNELVYKKVSYEEGVRCNPAEYESMPRPRERNTFFGDMNRFEFSVLQRKYVAAPVSVSFIISKIKRQMKRLFTAVFSCREGGGKI